MRVNLRGRRARVAEELLHASQVCSTFEQIRREGVSEIMWRVVGVNARSHERLLQHLADGILRISPSSVAKEEPIVFIMRSDELWSSIAKICPNRRYRHLVQGHNPLFTPLSEHLYLVHGEIDAIEREARNF